ncbi:MAG: hypothetical protein K5697_02910 [Lachnospiraceae bacterium]|nr:hypothetical protein [Lachnospiraceae bacterium]
MENSIQLEYSVQFNAVGKSTSTPKAVPRPVWDPKKVYLYLEDMSEGFQAYKRQSVQYFRSEFASTGQDRAISVEELKKSISSYFPEYTFADREPEDVVKGKYYLYIDNKQLGKMASDPAYRAKVFGLMDSELQGKKGYTLRYTSGKNVTNHITGSVFSLAEKNRSIPGVGQMPGSEAIPYHGSACGDPSCSVNGVAQLRDPSFVDRILHPGRSIAERRSAEETKHTMADEHKAAQRREVHKEELRMQYQEFLKDKSQAERLQERFLTDLDAREKKHYILYGVI